MKNIIEYYYRRSSYSYKEMIRKINMDERDYHKFMSLLHKYNIISRNNKVNP